jgi:hypothetical protein
MNKCKTHKNVLVGFTVALFNLFEFQERRAIEGGAFESEVGQETPIL